MGTESEGGRRGRGVPVETLPSEGGALFEVHMETGTRYLRCSVGEVYEEGMWNPHEGCRAIPYKGGELGLNFSTLHPYETYTFYVKPLVNLTDHIPVTLNVERLVFDGEVEYYPSLQVFYTPNAFSETYWVTHREYQFSEEELRAAEVTPLTHCLGVPEEMGERLREMAEEAVGAAYSPYDQLRALEAYLRENYVYDANYTPPPRNIDPVEWFLFHERRGTCSHFNSALALLARALGIPARVVRGYLVSPDAEYQLVAPGQAHTYVEVPFEGLGWVIFDATPEETTEAPEKESRISTVTNITWCSPTALRGGGFIVVGSVNMWNGTPVSGMEVQVFLKPSKNETGFLVGVGVVDEGLFNITCATPPEAEVGDYHVVARAVGNEVYMESWSDPKLRLMSRTEVAVEAPPKAYVGEEIAIKGRVKDPATGRPIANVTLLVVVDGETHLVETDGEGRFTFLHTFNSRGNASITISVPPSDYYLPSEGRVTLEIEPSRRSPFMVLLGFPNNLILATAGALVVAALILGRRKEEVVEEVEEGAEKWEPLVEPPLTFENYRDGVVKLYNRLYVRAKRRYGVGDHLTARELQIFLLRELPDGAAYPLEVLVSTFERANYGGVEPTKAEFERCKDAFDILVELMKHER
ncbi:MAG: Transglutaminase-like superfamily [Candidatus Bathyarchaeota archaeon B23]|nr:MAG: Transglutaminase-like superfamily [Candidatus Bathyarchaeota archaeon B23]